VGTAPKLLTVAIPTWNRANYLQQLLDQLTFQVATLQLENKIEILVSNNNSDDDTEAVVHRFESRFPFITYSKNSTNIGAKSNVIKAMELARAEYVMLLGDDDRIGGECMKSIIKTLESRDNVGILIDQSHAKERKFKIEKEITLAQLVESYYWYMGNAGVFIMRTEFVKLLRKKYDFDFFNECWPQTQIMLVGIEANPNYACYIEDLNVHSNSLHDEVMIYSSFYIWRTCYYELTNAINTIRDTISNQVYNSAKVFLKKNLTQQVFNILQCGVFVDDNEQRNRTIKHIRNNLSLFSSYEKSFLWIIIIVLSLPPFISRLFSNIFILGIRGIPGLKKKNEFVDKELKKKQNQGNIISIRALEFEK